MNEYDPKTCITAGEFREMGATLPEGIPDCAWVPRDSVTWSLAIDVSPNPPPPERGKISVPLMILFNKPFKWVEIKATIGP